MNFAKGDENMVLGMIFTLLTLSIFRQMKFIAMIGRQQPSVSLASYEIQYSISHLSIVISFDALNSQMRTASKSHLYPPSEWATKQ